MYFQIEPSKYYEAMIQIDPEKQRLKKLFGKKFSHLGKLLNLIEFGQPTPQNLTDNSITKWGQIEVPENLHTTINRKHWIAGKMPSPPTEWPAEFIYAGIKEFVCAYISVTRD